MPLYQYSAFDAKGKRRSGLVEAQSEKDAKDKLREQGVMVTKVEMKTRGASRENLRGENLLNFTLQLSQLISAGIPLYQSLNTIEEQYRGEAYHRVLLSLCEQIRTGTPLSLAMAGFPDSFSKLYCSMIAAGESVGGLNEVLEKLGDLLTKQMKLKRQIQTAMIYPAILGVFSLMIITLLLTFVVPSIESIFEGRKLNAFTNMILTLSYFFRTYWWAYLPIGGALIAFLVYKIRSPAGVLWRQRNFLKVPVIRTLVIQTAVARFCRTMGTLLTGGLTIIDALQISREVMNNVTMEEEIKRAEGKIVEGSSLSTELARSKYFPQLVSRMLAVGEDSGTSTVMLNKIADMYEDEVEKSLEQVMALAQPVILIFMGLIIGSVLMAILLPLTDVSSFAM